MEKPDMVDRIKDDLREVTEVGLDTDLGYKLLDDGNLVVQTYYANGSVETTYIVNISIGRELTKEEWQGPF